MFLFENRCWLGGGLGSHCWCVWSCYITARKARLYGLKRDFQKNSPTFCHGRPDWKHFQQVRPGSQWPHQLPGVRGRRLEKYGAVNLEGDGGSVQQQTAAGVLELCGASGCWKALGPNTPRQINSLAPTLCSMCISAHIYASCLAAIWSIFISGSVICDVILTYNKEQCKRMDFGGFIHVKMEARH